MTRDRELIQIVDAAMAEAVQKSGAWIACRPGCFECCIGPFAITPLDAVRLRQGLASLESRDPARAARVHDRAARSIARMTRDYPGDTIARVLGGDDSAVDEPCPALDPASGTCDLYEWRPITCRTFGPAVRFDGRSLAVCELCYEGATEEQIAACAVDVDPQNVENELLSEIPGGDTLVAWALTRTFPS